MTTPTAAPTAQSKLLIRDVPAALKTAIRGEVEATGRNMNDLLVEILAKRYEVLFEPTGRRPDRPPGPSSKILLRMPDALHERIGVASKVRKIPMQTLAKSALCEHFGVRLETPPPRRRRRTLPAAA